MPSLEGLRGVAILAVMAFHFAGPNVKVLAGGFVGVDAFLVLSGFPITSLLTLEFDRRRTHPFGRFAFPADDAARNAVDSAIALFYGSSGQSGGASCDPLAHCSCTGFLGGRQMRVDKRSAIHP